MSGVQVIPHRARRIRGTVLASGAIADVAIPVLRRSRAQRWLSLIIASLAGAEIARSQQPLVEQRRPNATGRHANRPCRHRFRAPTDHDSRGDATPTNTLARPAMAGRFARPAIAGARGLPSFTHTFARMDLASLAGKELQSPEGITTDQIKKLAASVLRDRRLPNADARCALGPAPLRRKLPASGHPAASAHGSCGGAASASPDFRMTRAIRATAIPGP